jgi:ATP-dependent HslUV protease ATP-binding subunit HslU
VVFLMPGETAPGEAAAAATAGTAPVAGARTPREIVAELDKFVIGPGRAKKAVAIALRNRWRRQQLDPEMSREILPKNILMIGPTGVGKTEIARRLARLADAPFLKVEASKFTEVGYVGRDVESIIRDLTEVAVQMVREERTAEIRDRAKTRTEQRLVDLLAPPTASETDAEQTRNQIRQLLREGRLEERLVEVEVMDKTFPSFEIVTDKGVEEMDINVKEMLPGLFGGKKKRRKTPIKDAREILQAEEEGRLVDAGQVAREAVDRAQSSGIVFLDEIDKVAGRESNRSGPDVSREGVQRDLLPIVEGTVVNTKYGFVKTDHVLFIAAGAFHVSKPSDLIPELQGRFPIRVELDSLTEEDFVRILTEPENALLKQYRALLSAEDVDLSFSDEAVREIARDAERVNRALENIGARRLHTILERLLEEISFAGPENAGRAISIGVDDVRTALADLVRDEDLSRYVL